MKRVSLSEDKIIGFVKHAVSSVGKVLGGGSSSKSSGSTTTAPWSEAQPYLTGIMSQAQQQFNNTGGINEQFQNKNVADLTSEMQNAVNYGQTTGTAAMQRLNEMAKTSYDSDIVNQQIARAQEASSDQLAGALNQINRGAAQTGTMGSSRAGVASGVAAGEANQNLLDATTQIQQQARQQAYGLAQGQSQQDMANLLSTGGITQTQAQNKADTDWFNRVGAQNQGWENLGKYAGIIGQAGSGGSTTTQQAPQQSTFNKVLGAASSVAGIASLFSDASLKTNVKKVGEDQDGNARYEWDWNKEGEKLGLKGKGSGVLAQQIAKTNPDAINVDAASGKMKVDYNKVGGKSPKPKKR